MKEILKKLFKDKLNRAAVISSLIWFWAYFMFGAAIFKNMWNTSPLLPFVGGIIALLPFLAEILNVSVLKNRVLDCAITFISILFCILHFLFFAYVLSKLNYFFIEGLPYFITVGLLAVVGFFVFLFPKLDLLLKKITASVIASLIALICITTLFNATPFFISGGATVFTVGEEYQIAFATSHKSTGAIEVNGTTYCDIKNGSNNISKLHKISVPASRLDDAKAYTIRTQSVAIDSAYLPSQGMTITKKHNFRPIDITDGVQIYNLSDTHEVVAGPANAASYFGDKLDLLILNGDIINDVSSEYQVSIIYKLAHRVTKGERPVIFARGNHECIGKLSSGFSEFVGSANNNMYFDYRLGDTLSLLVLDTATDMADNNPLVAPIANFDELRKEESAWLKERGNRSEGAKYKLVISHMAFPLSSYHTPARHWYKWAAELVDLTGNSADLAICGHSHKTKIDYGKDVKTAYPVVRGAIRSNKYADREGVSPFEFTGTAIELSDGKINVKFTNAKKQVLNDYTLETENG